MDVGEFSSERFAVPDRAEWEMLAEDGLRGRTLASLVSFTADGIEIAPVYAGDQVDVSGDPSGLPGLGDRTRGSLAAGGSSTGWDVRALVNDKGVEDANATVLDELACGSTSLLLDVEAIGVASVDHLDAVLAEVHLEMVTVALLGSPTGVEAAGWLLDLWERRETPVGSRSGLLGLDPVGVKARYGSGTSPTSEHFSNELLSVLDRSRGLPGVRAFSLDGTVFADAGASDARELGWTTANGVSVLRALVDHGLSIDDALNQIAFTWSADIDQFGTICRLRAARRLWARVAEASGATPKCWGQVQHAMGSAVDLTQRDPWGNLLRGTVAAFGGGVGGANAVTVRPFDSAIGRSDAFSRRTARNTQLLLLEESSLATVVDPAGGSWFVEDLTSRMAETAWERFREIEVAGGVAAALASGLLAGEAEICWKARQVSLASRTEAITGVSEFPNLDEEPLERSAAPAPAAGPLPLRRRSAIFETLRDTADAATGIDAPVVRLVLVGAFADHNARSTFAVNLYAVAGILAVSDFKNRVSSPVAVVCGSDSDYLVEGVATVTSLRAEGVTRIHLVANVESLSVDLVHALKDAGVDDFVHAHTDLVDLLGRTLVDLGLDDVKTFSGRTR